MILVLAMELQAVFRLVARSTVKVAKAMCCTVRLFAGQMIEVTGCSDSARAMQASPVAAIGMRSASFTN